MYSAYNQQCDLKSPCFGLYCGYVDISFSHFCFVFTNCCPVLSSVTHAFSSGFNNILDYDIFKFKQEVRHSGFLANSSYLAPPALISFDLVHASQSTQVVSESLDSIHHVKPYEWIGIWMWQRLLHHHSEIPCNWLREYVGPWRASWGQFLGNRFLDEAACTWSL